MKKLNLKRIFIYFFLFVVMFLSLSVVAIPNYSVGKVKINIYSDKNETLQLFYTQGKGNFNFDEPHSLNAEVSTSKNKTFKDISIVFPQEAQELRIDFGSESGINFSITSLEILKGNKKCFFSSEELSSLINSQEIKLNQIVVSENNGFINFRTEGNDSYILLTLDYLEPINNIYYFITAFFIAFVFLIVIYKFVYLEDVYLLAKSVFNDRKLLLSLALNDFKVKFAGSYFGILWAFVQPICTILIFWFVFTFGLKSSPVSDVPFALWLTAGIVPWFFFSDAWSSATNCFMEYSYLVKKVVFKIDILPLVKILSAFFVHLFFVAFLVGLYTINGVFPALRMVGIFYYMICMIVLIIGISFITASVVIFFRDLTQIINIILQIMMWLTPIMWDINILPIKLIKFFKLNPMFYIVQGYRNCMIGSEPVFPSFSQTIYFWFIIAFLFFAGISLFRRLKVHFADVL
ncbi:MAG: ABC transporter permease [Lachnospiraceae bacterium]|nr:ABC transporter permease [Lachnospiraceae bacterium]